MAQNPPKQEFDVLLEKHDGIDAAYFTVPFNVQEVYGKKGQVKVKATIDGYVYRGSIAPMGGGTHVMGVKKDIRAAIDKRPGDTVHVVLEVDVDERVVTVPEDFRAALKRNPQAKTVFAGFAFTHRKEYVQWVESAKKPETRAERIVKAIERIAQGLKFS